jgi:membrane protein implicated in regulation of membrane protease activity
MNPKSAKTFVWAAIISILVGMAVMSPAGSFFLYLMSALCAAVPTIFGAKRTRIAGALILAVSIVLLAVTYPKFNAEMTKYRERAHKKSSEMSAPPTLPLNLFYTAVCFNCAGKV